MLILSWAESVDVSAAQADRISTKYFNKAFVSFYFSFMITSVTLFFLCIYNTVRVYHVMPFVNFLFLWKLLVFFACFCVFNARNCLTQFVLIAHAYKCGMPKILILFYNHQKIALNNSTFKHFWDPFCLLFKRGGLFTLHHNKESRAPWVDQLKIGRYLLFVFRQLFV